MSAIECNLQGISVMIGIPCGPDLPWQTVQSLVETVMELKDRGIPFELKLVSGCSIVQKARNKVAHEFLASRMSRLFMIDSDMQWSSKDFVRLLALSTKMSVVCGAYRAKMDPPTFMLGEQDLSSLETNEYGCLPINGVGLGFTVVSDTVIGTLAYHAQQLDDGPYIFRCDVHNGAFRGEDMAFFADVREIGHQVWLDPSVCLGHVGTKTYTGSIMDAMVKL
ncbi:hypothetical protein GALL_153350 [mine drainage metagenome]|uniref:Glycosyltransferase 2-like domain-containing protein n=1 Tax=mine drainage metagenome TaxID=410659 RepID=A0A1J5SEH9_9ZZZZ